MTVSGAARAVLRPTLIVNTNTGAERLFGLVGDVRLKVNDKVVEYRRLEPTRQKCEPNPIARRTAT